MQPQALDRDLIRKALGTEFSAVPVHVFERVRSTNDTVRDLLAGAPDEPFVAVVAEVQEQGRGRRGRSWIAPRGKNIQLSVGMRYAEDAVSLGEWPLLASWAVYRALGTVAAQGLAIKWPNDILLHEKKVCGILTELGVSSQGSILVVGVGVNVLTTIEEFPDDLRSRASSLLIETGVRHDRNPLIAELVRRLHAIYLESLHGVRFADIWPAWRPHCETIGKHVTVTQGNSLVRGIVTDVDAAGSLQLIDETGTRRTIISGEIIESVATN